MFNEAMLHGRCRYLLVDNFDYETTISFLKKHGFSREEIELAWKYLGGKPVYLVEVVKGRDRLKEFCEELLEDRISSILYRIKSLKRKDENSFKRVIRLLERFKDSEAVECD